MMIRKTYISILLMLCCLPVAAQLNGTGFYRFRNAAQASDYISMANDLFNYTTCISTAGGGLGQLALWDPTNAKARTLACAGKYLETDIHMVEDNNCVNPGSIIYAKKKNTNSNNYEYNLIGQGTSLLTLTTGTYPGNATLIFQDRYVTISQVGGSGASSLYTASIELIASNYDLANLGIRYLVDNSHVLAINTSSSAQNAKWYIEPVTHFNVQPEVEYGGKYYTTLYVPYAFQLSGQVETAYVVTAINTDGTLELEEVATNGGTVPAGTPVILECSSNATADCQLIPIEEPLFTAPDVNATSGAPRASTATNYTGTNLLKGTYYCNTDGAMTFSTKSGTGSFKANNFTSATDKLYVLGGTSSSGKLKLIKAKTDKGFTNMPANKAWIEYTGTAELVLPFASSLVGDIDRDGDFDIDDVTAQVNIILRKDTPADNYDYVAADVDGSGTVDIDDVTGLVNLILGKAY